VLLILLYCTSLVTEPTKTLHWEQQLTVYDITATCFGPWQPLSGSIIYKKLQRYSV